VELTVALQTRPEMLVSLLLLAATVAAQLDDFACPDEFLGFYPHLISCDKYWACQDGVQELRTCGNGLAFIDTDEGMKVSYDIWTVLSWSLLRVTSHRHHITSRQQLSRPCIKQSALLLCLLVGY